MEKGQIWPTGQLNQSVYIKHEETLIVQYNFESDNTNYTTIKFLFHTVLICWCLLTIEVTGKLAIGREGTGISSPTLNSKGPTVGFLEMTGTVVYTDSKLPGGIGWSPELNNTCTHCSSGSVGLCVVENTICVCC